MKKKVIPKTPPIFLVKVIMSGKKGQAKIQQPMLLDGVVKYSEFLLELKELR